VTRVVSAQRYKVAVVAVIAVAITAGLAARILSDFGWDATAFVGFGEDATAIREYAEERLGEVVLRQAAGHDGKFFFIQANDPWVTEAGDRVELFDYPVHRSRRMLYPLLAGGLGLFGPGLIVWSLLVSNVIWMGFGTWGTARLAQALGGSPWWGLVFTLNIGLVFTLIIDGAGILALALAVWAVYFLYENRFASSVALLAASALTREAMLVCAIGVATCLWSRGRRRHALLAFGIPALVLGLWESYLRIRLGPDPGLPGSFGLPFVGLARAMTQWTREPIVMAFGACLLILAVLLVRRWWVGRSLLSWAFIGFVPLAILFTAPVWTEFFDFTRVLAPLFTASILVVFVEDRTAGEDQQKLQRVQGSRKAAGSD
jgi:hypothetical protein